LEKACVLISVVFTIADQVDLVFTTAGARGQAGHDDMNICNLTIPNPIHPGDLGTVVLRVAVSAVTIEEYIGPRI
jgi:hypothetical protein